MSKHTPQNVAQLAAPGLNTIEFHPFNVTPKPASKAARTRKQARSKANRNARATLYSTFQGNNRWNNCSEFHTTINALRGGNV